MKKITLIVLFLITSNYTYPQSSQSVLFMEKENGVYTLPCKVNGIPMKFIFDTGASNVSISLTEAQFLAKQGLLEESEILDSVKYQIANGEVKEGTRIILRQIEIDGHVLNNVEAFITHEINSPLLLGQSAISKLGKIEIEGNKLVITPKNPRNRFKFLNVDLSKHINDFGYSVVDLKEPLTPYPLEKFTEEEEHFLSKYNFDKEVVTFSQSGFIPIIILQKTFNEEKYPGDNLEKAKAFYTIIKEAIVRKYGTPSTANARVVEWNSSDYQMMLNLGSDNAVYLTYNNLNIKYFEKSKVNNKDTSTTSNSENAKNKSVITSFFNDYLKIFEQTDTNSFSRIKGETLEIYFEKKLDIFPPSVDSELYSDLKKMEQDLIRNYSHLVINDNFKNREDLKLVSDLGVQKFKFIMKIQYSDNTEAIVVKNLLVIDLESTSIPISKTKLSNLFY